MGVNQAKGINFQKYFIFFSIIFRKYQLYLYFCAGELAERSNAAVLKTVDCHRSGGSNPSLSAINAFSFYWKHFLF